jgi:hypothetical protein
MRKNVIPFPPELALDRVLAGLEKILVEATDAEIEQAAESLSMNLQMKGSAAFAGVLGPMPKRMEDIFELEDLRKAYAKFLSRQQTLLPPRGGSDDSEDN